MDVRTLESICNESSYAARTVAALFDLGAIGVEDTVVHIGVAIARRQQNERLIETDAGAAIG